MNIESYSNKVNCNHSSFIFIDDRFISLLGVLLAHPICNIFSLPVQARDHFSIYFRKIKDISNAIVSIFWINGALTEEAKISLRPHLVEFILVLVYTVWCLVFLKDFIQARGFYVVAIADYLFTGRKIILVLLVP